MERGDEKVLAATWLSKPVLKKVLTPTWLTKEVTEKKLSNCKVMAG
jgi:hypothetical protein